MTWQCVAPGRWGEARFLDAAGDGAATCSDWEVSAGGEKFSLGQGLSPFRT